MWARVARFEGDPAELDGRVDRLRELIDSGTLPPEVQDAKVLFLADRATGEVLSITLFESEEAMKTADGVMNTRRRPRGSPAERGLLRGAAPHPLSVQPKVGQ